MSSIAGHHKVSAILGSTRRTGDSWFNELTQTLGNAFPEAERGHGSLFLDLCLHRLDSAS